MSDWKQIATVEKNGMPLWGYGRGHLEYGPLRVVIMRPLRGPAPRNSCEWWTDDGRPFHPTHWLPLEWPKPPTLPGQ